MSEEVGHRDDDGYVEWWTAALEIRDGRVEMTVSFGGFQQHDMPLQVARDAVRFWSQALG